MSASVSGSGTRRWLVDNTESAEASEGLDIYVGAVGFKSIPSFFVGLPTGQKPKRQKKAVINKHSRVAPCIPLPPYIAFPRQIEHYSLQIDTLLNLK